jgi:hypothetical protein
MASSARKVTVSTGCVRCPGAMRGRYRCRVCTRAHRCKKERERERAREREREIRVGGLMRTMIVITLISSMASRSPDGRKYIMRMRGGGERGSAAAQVTVIGAHQCSCACPARKEGRQSDARDPP